MLRKLLAAIVLLALPALLAAQAPSTPPAAAARPAVAHGIAMHVQGEVASPVEGVEGLNNQEGVDEADGQNHDAQDEDGEFDQEGVNEPDGLNNDLDVGEHVDQAGENESDDEGAPAAPPSTGQIGQLGRHKP
jgi:hypothetical protein